MGSRPAFSTQTGMRGQDGLNSSGDVEMERQQQQQRQQLVRAERAAAIDHALTSKRKSESWARSFRGLAGLVAQQAARRRRQVSTMTSARRVRM